MSTDQLRKATSRQFRENVTPEKASEYKLFVLFWPLESGMSQCVYNWGGHGCKVSIPVNDFGC